MTTSQLEKDGIPTFYIATNGTVCTHRMNESDIPVWCQSSEDGAQVMDFINLMKQYMPKPCKGEWESPATTCPDAPCNDCTHSLQEQVKQLTAQNERFRNALTPHIVDWIYCGMATNGRLKEEWAWSQYKNLKSVIKESPIASVAEIQGQAVNEFAQEVGVFDPEYDDQEYVEIPRYKVREYIESMRQQRQEATQ